MVYVEIVIFLLYLIFVWSIRKYLICTLKGHKWYPNETYSKNIPLEMRVRKKCGRCGIKEIMK